MRQQFDGNRQYDVKPLFTGSKRGWTVLDLFTASAIQSVYKAINETNRAKFDRIPLPSLVEFVFKAVV